MRDGTSLEDLKIEDCNAGASMTLYDHSYHIVIMCVCLYICKCMLNCRTCYTVICFLLFDKLLISGEHQIKGNYK